MRVRATQRGYYGGKVREPGEEFGLKDEKHFSSTWMVETEAGRQAKAEAEAKPKTKAAQPGK